MVMYHQGVRPWLAQRLAQHMRVLVDYAQERQAVHHPRLEAALASQPLAKSEHPGDDGQCLAQAGRGGQAVEVIVEVEVIDACADLGMEAVAQADHPVPHLSPAPGTAVPVYHAARDVGAARQHRVRSKRGSCAVGVDQQREEQVLREIESCGPLSP